MGDPCWIQYLATHVGFSIYNYELHETDAAISCMLRITWSSNDYVKYENDTLKELNLFLAKS